MDSRGTGHLGSSYGRTTRLWQEIPNPVKILGLGRLRTYQGMENAPPQGAARFNQTFGPSCTTRHSRRVSDTRRLSMAASAVGPRGLTSAHGWSLAFVYITPGRDECARHLGRPTRQRPQLPASHSRELRATHAKHRRPLCSRRSGRRPWPGTKRPRRWARRCGVFAMPPHRRFVDAPSAANINICRYPSPPFSR